MKQNKIMNRIWKLIKPELKSIGIISILSIIISVIEISKPYIIKVAIDDYLSLGIYQKGIITIGMIGAFYIALVVIGNIIDFIVKTATSMLGENVVYTLRNKLYKYIQHANITFHDNTPAGKLFVRTTNEIVLDHGQIVEEGNNDELVKTGVYYSKLYQAYYSSLTE